MNQSLPTTSALAQRGIAPGDAVSVSFACDPETESGMELAGCDVFHLTGTA